MDVESRLKTALDESRLLILGVQVLFGFQFEAVFQELFSDIPASSRYVHSAGLVLLLVSVCLLIAPSLFTRSCSTEKAGRPRWELPRRSRAPACCR